MTSTIARRFRTPLTVLSLILAPLAGFLAGSALTQLAGCEGGAANVADARQALTDSHAALEEAKAAQTAALADAKAKQDAAAAAAAEKNLKTLAKADGAIGKVSQGLDAVTNPDGTVNVDAAGRAAVAAAWTINPYAGLAVTLGLPLITGLVQQRRVNAQALAAQTVAEQARAVVASIEAARQVPAFAAAFNSAIPIIDAVQTATPGTKALVDSHQPDPERLAA